METSAAIFDEIRATLTGMKAEAAESNRIVAVMAKNVWCVDELALYLRLSADRVSRMEKERLFPSYKQNGKYFFKRQEIEAWQTANRTSSIEETASQSAMYCIKNR